MLRSVVSIKKGKKRLMNSIREKLSNMFSKVMAGTVTREEGTMLINHLAKENLVETVSELSYLIDTPPPGVFSKTILHTIALARNKSFHNILVASLDHKNEDVSILAAEELARLKTSEAQEVLVEHLTSDVYHVRKASAAALAQFPEGLATLKEHILTHSEPFYRLTSAQALIKAGKQGIETLLSILNSGKEDAVKSIAEALIAAGKDLGNSEIPKIFEALMMAGDRKDTQSILGLLKVAGSLKGKARGFEGYVMAFEDHPTESVRKEAQDALKQIKAALE